MGTTPQIAGRLTAWVYFLLAAALVSVIGTKVYSYLVGFVAFVLVTFLPFGWQWGNAPVIEFAATAAALVSVLLILYWVERRNWWLLGGLTVTLTVLFLVKVTTGIVWLIPS